MGATMAVGRSSPKTREISGSLMTKTFYVFAGLALAAIAISLAGKWFGQTISHGGHTDSMTLREIVIGNNVIVAPDNMIRFPDARRDGVTARLDLYMRWPDLRGYGEAVRNDFNHANGSKTIVFLTFEEASMSRDMSGRLAPIYNELIDRPGAAGVGGLTIYDFSEKSGYLDEMLAVAARSGETPFVARCLKGEAAAQSLAPCERDIQLGDGLSLTFRFPAELLKEWPKLEAAMRARATSMLKTAKS
ncbi:MAG: hypothetical protein AB7P20_03375 [Rhizobiaceae bacterium]